jgi:hypothetical protein
LETGGVSIGAANADSSTEGASSTTRRGGFFSAERDGLGSGDGLLFFGRGTALGDAGGAGAFLALGARWGGFRSGAGRGVRFDRRATGPTSGGAGIM